jgi:hypothetical protein
MNKSKIYTTVHRVSAVFMILALLWLTVSTPFVFKSQQVCQEHMSENSQSPLQGNEEESTNPFGNSTEEKKPGANSLSEEYLHDANSDEFVTGAGLRYHNVDAGTYIAYHGELLVPPPNIG